MAEISLYVTQAALDHAQGMRENQRQIAYSDPSSSIAPRLATVTGQDRVKLRLAGRLTLVVGDRTAIWLAHNGPSAADFNNLFAFLANYPDRRLRFVCELLD